MQALTAEVNMQTSQLAEHKTEVTQLRNEINDWKKKFYDCRRKAVPQSQYVSASSPRFALDNVDSR